MQMTPQNAYAIVFLACAITAVIVGNFFMYAMLGKVNARLRPEDRFWFVGFNLPKIGASLNDI
jgi:hypothetical protein